MVRPTIPGGPELLTRYHRARKLLKEYNTLDSDLITPHVQIYTAIHPLKASERLIHQRDRTRYLTSTKPATIGDNVWIGGNSVIFPRVTIGNNVTIGAGSVVTKSIPDDVLAYGNPCKVIKPLGS